MRKMRSELSFCFAPLIYSTLRPQKSRVNNVVRKAVTTRKKTIRKNRFMPKVTIVFGLLLCGLSAVVLLLKAEFKLGTWLIPSGVGLPLIVLGILAAAQPSARKHYMHAAVTLGLLGGLLALFQGVSQLVKLAGGAEVNSLAAGMVWAMTVICFAFVGLCIQSFIAARKAREKLSEGGQTT